MPRPRPYDQSDDQQDRRRRVTRGEGFAGAFATVVLIAAVGADYAQHGQISDVLVGALVTFAFGVLGRIFDSRIFDRRDQR